MQILQKVGSGASVYCLKICKKCKQLAKTHKNNEIKLNKMHKKPKVQMEYRAIYAQRLAISAKKESKN